MMSLDDQRRLAKWLVQIGKNRVITQIINIKLKNENAFTVTLYKAFLVTGLGNSFATAKMEELKFRARQAKQSIFDFLDKKEKDGTLEELFDELGLKILTGLGFGKIRQVIRHLLEIERVVNMRNNVLNEEEMTILYNSLGEIYGIGEKIRHLIIYDLIRLFGFDLPKGLKLYDELLEKLRFLGITDPEEIFKPEDYPYVDAALWDL